MSAVLKGRKRLPNGRYAGEKLSYVPVGEPVRGRQPILPYEDRQLVRALVRENLATKKKLAEVHAQLLDLMDERDRLLQEALRTQPDKIAEKFGISHSQITYLTRLRSGRRLLEDYDDPEDV